MLIYNDSTFVTIGASNNDNVYFDVVAPISDEHIYVRTNLNSVTILIEAWDARRFILFPNEEHAREFLAQRNLSGVSKILWTSFEV